LMDDGERNSPVDYTIMWRELAGIPGKCGLGVPAEETVGSCVDAVSAAFYAPHPGQHAAWAEWITAWLELLRKDYAEQGEDGAAATAMMKAASPKSSLASGCWWMPTIKRSGVITLVCKSSMSYSKSHLTSSQSSRLVFTARPNPAAAGGAGRLL